MTLRKEKRADLVLSDRMCRAMCHVSSAKIWMDQVSVVSGRSFTPVNLCQSDRPDSSPVAKKAETMKITGRVTTWILNNMSYPYKAS